MPSGDYRPLLRSNGVEENSSSDLSDTEAQGEKREPSSPHELALTPRSLSAALSEQVPPEWVLLLLGCALGLTTGASVVLFNLTVHGIHNLAWAGTPAEGAAWLRVQPLALTWHRIMLIPVLGGVVVGILHALTAIISSSSSSSPSSHSALPTSSPPTSPPASPRHPTSSSSSSPFFSFLGSLRSLVDWGSASRPVIKAVQAAVTLGTGSSLGPEGPSVDIGKAWAEGMGEVWLRGGGSGGQEGRQRRLALVAAGAAAGISSGFNAAVAGCFFAIETVLQSSSNENAPPLTTAMIILASVLSSTVSNVVLGEEPAFTVPEYELKSAAELPLYLLLGMVCGIISVIFTRLIRWSTALFDFLRDRLGVPPAVTPALGGLLVGFIALKYPGVLYWGFSNVNEILHSRESASAPGPRHVSQLVAAKIVATALAKGSGLVGGIYAPSLFIGSAVGSVYGSLAGAAINAAVSGTGAQVAAPQAYALVGMAAMLASVCSVPLTSVLLLFELTKDYRILLPLMGAVGLAYWVSSVANRKPGKPSLPPSHPHPDTFGQSQAARASLLAPLVGGPTPEVELAVLSQLLGPENLTEEQLLEDIKVSQALVSSFVSLPPSATVQQAVAAMAEARCSCCLIVERSRPEAEEEGLLLEGVLTMVDIQREAVRLAMDIRQGIAGGRGDSSGEEIQSIPIGSISSTDSKNLEGLLVAYPDMNLKTAIRLMAPQSLQQLPVVARGMKRWQDRGRKVIGLVDRESISLAYQIEATKRILALLPQVQKESHRIHLSDAH